MVGTACHRAYIDDLIIFRSQNFYGLFLDWKNDGEAVSKQNCFSLNFDHHDQVSTIQGPADCHQKMLFKLIYDFQTFRGFFKGKKYSSKNFGNKKIVDSLAKSQWHLGVHDLTSNRK